VTAVYISSYMRLHLMNCLLMTLSHTILEELAMDIGNDDGGDVSAVYISSFMCLHLMNCLLMTLSHTILEEYAMDIGNDDDDDVTAVVSPPTSVNTR